MDERNMTDVQLDLSLFRFAGNDIPTLSHSPDLATRQAVADQYHSPQRDFGSLIDVLEWPANV